MQISFIVLEAFVCTFGHRVNLQYNLSSIDRWIDREDQHDIGGDVGMYVMHQQLSGKSTFHW